MRRPVRRGAKQADPRQIERRYQAFLARMVAEIAKATRAVLFQAIERAPLPDAPRGDDMPGDLADLIAQIKAQTNAGVVRTIGDVEDFATRTAGFNRQQFLRSVRSAIGVDILAADPSLNALIASWTADNAGLIRSIADDMLDQVADVTRRAFAEGQSVRGITAEIEGRFEVGERRARLIARDQIGKLNGQITEERNKALGITTYEWATAQDERVRDTHTPLHGKICRWDDATLYRESGSDEWRPRSEIGAIELHPGQDIQCRCTSFAIIEV